MKRLLFMLPSLAGGGAERTICLLMDHLDRSRFEPKVGLLAATGPNLSKVDPADLILPAKDLPVEDGLSPSLIFRSLITQRETILRFRPHLVMSATVSMNLLSWWALKLSGGGSWIAREGNNTAAVINDELANPILASARKWLTGFCLNRADLVLAISRGVAEGLERELRVNSSRLAVIGNPVDLSRCRAWKGPTKTILSAGRLTAQKGFDTLLRAFASISIPGTKLRILGEGPERNKLLNLASSLGVGSRFELPGYVDDPWTEMASAGVFVSSSRWEGFGSAILEAMGCGVPVVVSDCDYGPREIVTHEQNGLIVGVGKEASLAAALERILDQPELAQNLGQAARKRAQDFEAKKITGQYELLFERVL